MTVSNIHPQAYIVSVARRTENGYHYRYLFRSVETGLFWITIKDLETKEVIVGIPFKSDLSGAIHRLNTVR